MTAFAPRGGRCPRSQGSSRRVLRQALLAGATVALLGATSPSAWAARCDSQKDPITIKQNVQIDFGTIVVTTSAGTVRITPAGALSTPGSPSYTLLGGGAAGQFSVTGKQGCAVTISFLDGVLMNPAANTMTITNFTTNAVNPFFNSAGSLAFSVGADLVVNSNQPDGTYTGTYTITVIY